MRTVVVLIAAKYPRVLLDPDKRTGSSNHHSILFFCAEVAFRPYAQ
jgi:hypothetical protein